MPDDRRTTPSSDDHTTTEKAEGSRDHVADDAARATGDAVSETGHGDEPPPSAGDTPATPERAQRRRQDGGPPER